jgi:hypothetical protein
LKSNLEESSKESFFFISRKFTIYSTNSAISKYVVLAEAHRDKTPTTQLKSTTHVMALRKVMAKKKGCLPMIMMMINILNNELHKPG